MEFYNLKKRYLFVFLILSVLVAVLFVANISFGSVSVSFENIAGILFGAQSDGSEYKIIWTIRMPRAIAAFMLGGALAVSGFLMQTFFHNPIASPFVLGISSGAELFVALNMVIFISFGISISSLSLIVFSFAGSMVCTVFILMFSKKANSSVLIVGGIMAGYICSAITDFVVTFASDTDIVNIHNWSMGSFSGISWKDVNAIIIFVLFGFILAFVISKPISAYQLGEKYAKNLGVNLSVFKAALIITSSILSSCVTAFAGPVSFVGVAVPHVIKSLMGTSKPIIIIPACFLGGAVYCLLCDLIARTLFSPIEVSISSVTAIFGAPIVIFILLKRKKGI